MKKLVPESIEEALRINKEKKLNEGKISDFLKKTVGVVKGMFKKIGNFFVSVYQEKLIPVFAPVNIGILVKSGALKNIGYVPNDEDIALEPALSSLKGGRSMINRAITEYRQMAAQNKTKNKIKQFESLNEEQVKLSYSGEDEMKNVNSDFLVKRIQLQILHLNLITFFKRFIIFV